jgi:hypothetical protein
MRKERQDVVVVEVVGVSCRVNLLILFTAALLNCSIFTKYILFYYYLVAVSRCFFVVLFILNTVSFSFSCAVSFPRKI